jgi:hypothetical protein
MDPLKKLPSIDSLSDIARRQAASVADEPLASVDQWLAERGIDPSEAVARVKALVAQRLESLSPTAPSRDHDADVAPSSSSVASWLKQLLMLLDARTVLREWSMNAPGLLSRTYHVALGLVGEAAPVLGEPQVTYLARLAGGSESTEDPPEERLSDLFTLLAIRIVIGEGLRARIELPDAVGGPETSERQVEITIQLVDVEGRLMGRPMRINPSHSAVSQPTLITGLEDAQLASLRARVTLREVPVYSGDEG